MPLRFIFIIYVAAYFLLTLLLFRHVFIADDIFMLRCHAIDAITPCLRLRR